MSYESNDDFAQVMQERYAIPLYADYWGTGKDKITEVDKENRRGDNLAHLLDGGGVDKILSSVGNVMIAQRIRRPRNFDDFTIRRQAQYEWDAEYSKLKESYEGDATTPSIYAYGDASQNAKDEVVDLLSDATSFDDVDVSNMQTPIGCAFDNLRLIDLDRFLKLEFDGPLQKKTSPASHDSTDDIYYWENTGYRDNGFYAWDWSELKKYRLVKASYTDGELHNIQSGDGEENADKESGQLALTDWGDD